MYISIDTAISGGVECVTATANGREDCKDLLGRLIPQMLPAKPFKAPDRMSLFEAASFLNDLSSETASFLNDLSSDPDVAESNRQTLKGVATLLEQLADGGKKIQAIKTVRELTGMGLQSAKEAVERTAPFKPYY